MYRLLNTARVLLILCCFPLVVFALSVSQSETIHVIADSSTYNYKTGTTTYEGNVKIKQGTTMLTADRVVTNNKNHKLQEAVAYGITKLAEYTTLPEEGEPLFHASAKIIKFYPPTSTIVLQGNVIVHQGKNSFQGPMIIYNIKEQIVTAPASNVGRATVIIEPDQLKS